MEWLIFIAGVLFLLYFLAIAFFIPHGTSFFVVWLAAALLCFGAFFLIHWKGNLLAALPEWLRKILIGIAVVGVLVFVFVEGCIISRFWAKAPADLDYIIVLGAQMKTSGPSRVLQLRLDAAFDYLQENEDTKVILSGGQGPDEPVSEARGMYDYLISRGVAGSRMIMEDQSTNTHQNMILSSAYLDKKNETVGIVTSNFHVFRAQKIGKKAGYEKICGIAAKAEPALLPNNMTREFIGVVKDFLVGNL